MPSQGPLAPGGSTSFGTGSTWVNTGNIALDDGSSFAACSIAGSGQSNNLEGNSFGFNIPLSASITGVVFTYKGKITSGFFGDVTDGQVAIGNLNNPQGVKNNGNQLGTSLTQISFGSSVDTWTTGSYLTPVNVNSNNFSIIAVWNNNVGSTRTIDIDAFRVTVFYTLPPTKFFSVLSGVDS